MKLLRISLVSLLCLTVLTPLVVVNVINPFRANSYVVGKVFWFRLLVEVAFGLWAVLAIHDPRARPRWSRPMLCWLALLGIMLIADSRSPMPYLAFWSTVDRQEGWVGLLHLFLFFMITSAVFTAADWRRYFGLSLVVSVMISALAVAQHAHYAAANQAGLQVISTLGNPVYLALYALIHIFIAFWLMSRPQAALPLMGLAVALACNLVSLYLTQSRGATLALAVGALVYGWGHLDNLGKLLASGLAIAACVILAALPFVDHADQYSQPMLLWRFAQIGTSDPRLDLWQSAIQLAAVKPLLGWGQEAFRESYFAFCHVNCGEADRVHNLELDWLVSGGLLGMWVYLGILLGARRAIAESRMSRGEKAALFGLLSAYFVDVQFFFDTITSYVPLMGVVAMSVGANPAQHAVRVVNPEAHAYLRN